MDTKMNANKFKFTKLQNEIFKLLCIKVGTLLNKREIARLLKVSPTAVAKSLPALEKVNLIKVEKDKKINLTLIELNRNNPETIVFKRVENLKLIYESGLADFLEEKFPGCLIILFGSYSLGEDTEKSDIDIAIIRAKEKPLDLKKFEQVLKRNVFLHFYEGLDEINKHLKSNIFNGITLSGVIEI